MKSDVHLYAVSTRKTILPVCSQEEATLVQAHNNQNNFLSRYNCLCVGNWIENQIRRGLLLIVE